MVKWFVEALYMTITRHQSASLEMGPAREWAFCEFFTVAIERPIYDGLNREELLL